MESIKVIVSNRFMCPAFLPCRAKMFERGGIVNTETEKKRIGKKGIILAGVVVVAAVCAAVWLFSGQTEGKEGLQLDENATIGILPGVDLEQRRAELQEQLDEGMIAFSVNTSPVFESGRAEGNLMLENPENNAKLLIAEIYMDETNELIYSSRAIPPGSYIENAMLDKVLDPGEYPATVFFKAYRESDETYIGQSGAAINITVLS